MVLQYFIVNRVYSTTSFTVLEKGNGEMDRWKGEEGMFISVISIDNVGSMIHLHICSYFYVRWRVSFFF